MHNNRYNNGDFQIFRRSDVVNVTTRNCCLAGAAAAAAIGSPITFLKLLTRLGGIF